LFIYPAFVAEYGFYLSFSAECGFDFQPLYAVFIYMMGILFRNVSSKFEVNLSCRLIFNSVGTFNLSVRS